MRRCFLIVLLFFAASPGMAQPYCEPWVDTSDSRVATAARFLLDYLRLFHDKKIPDYKKYWSAADCATEKIPDDMVFSVSSDVPTYRFSDHPVIFYAKLDGNYVHLKTQISNVRGDSAALFAICNHYVYFDDHGNPRFASELLRHKSRYREQKNGNILYHFPAACHFKRSVSDTMLARLRRIEKAWGLQSVPVNYYFAASAEELAHMRGLDYNWGMDETNPSGISSWQTKTIFCQGLGEGYLHEVLHIYFDPVYDSSAFRHALIYYLAGGLGHDFNWMIVRMATYLKQYPETDLSNVEELVTRDKMLHADHIAMGVLLRIIDRKDGVSGLKRMMRYKSLNEALSAEWSVTQERKNAFLKECIFREAAH